MLGTSAFSARTEFSVTTGCCKQDDYRHFANDFPASLYELAPKNQSEITIRQPHGGLWQKGELTGA